MNAPTLTRRGFTKGMGGIVLAFSLDPAELLAQAQPGRRGCPAASTTTACSTPGCASTPTAPPPCSPARSSSARASSPRCRRSRPRSSTCRLPSSRSISGDTGQTPDEGQTAGSQSIENSGTALRLAGAEVRAMLIDLAAPEARRRRRHAEGRGRRHQRRPTAARSPMASLPPSVDLKREATAKVAPKARVELTSIVGQSVPRARHPGQGHRRRGLCAGHAAGRHGARPRGAAAALRLDAGKRRRGGGQGRCPASSRWCATARSSASSPSARSRRSRRARRWRRRAKWKLGPELPDPAQHLRSSQVAAEQTDVVIGVKQAHGAGQRHSDAGGDLHQAVSGARLDRPVLRGRAVPRRQA